MEIEVQKVEHAATITVPMFKTSDGREFRPDFDGHPIEAAISRAKDAATRHERYIAERKQMEAVAVRLFGEKAPAILDALWTDQMRYFERRLDVLRTLDKIICSDSELTKRNPST